MHGLSFDIAHLLAGSLVLVSFMLLYQDRLYALLNVYEVSQCLDGERVGVPVRRDSAIAS